MEHPSFLKISEKNNILKREMQRRNTYKMKSAKDIYYKTILKPKK